ncbi:hypothetical protein L198_04916 [Cryptococcus wingfieldii CBS 7118]|uniref:Proteasome assembly chaperone 3 n=1 Tax=Cryptococcus wingfieldii CBS 7118 TaxID=1295528 RepID=A0A1E3J1R4_9TREE|nr:hypothetical protein L198_04916 [Cryptococcus wingfieldii CBS 7118]ODN94772.1 hypothetical protein L198_04916 [Cryptococcus wingfieldii CBS 7118]
MSSLLEESHPAQSVSNISATSKPPAPPPSPIRTYTLRRDICAVPTDLLIQTFDDRVLVIVTQSGKVGCLTQATLPQFTPLPTPPPPSQDLQQIPPHLQILSILPPPPPQTTLTPLLGSPPQQALHELYVSQIATLVWWALQTSGEARKGVVVGLALKREKGEGRADEDGEEEGLVEKERERYAGILDLVSQWPGSGE